MELSGRQLFISDVKTKAVHVSSLHSHLFSFIGRGINFRSNSAITDYEGLSIFVRNNRERSCSTLGPKRGVKFVRYIHELVISEFACIFEHPSNLRVPVIAEFFCAMC
jgi:hypothetical protein